jgi:serine protease Do
MKLAALACLAAAPLLAAAQHGLEHTSAEIQALVRKVSPAVVKVLVTGYGPVTEEGRGNVVAIGRQHAIGSGVIVDPAGFIITNAHVVAGAQRVQVVLPPPRGDEGLGSAVSHGRPLKAVIKGVDQTSDIAVLKVEAPASLPTLPIGDYRQVRQGQMVLAFGSPEGLDDSVSMGVVSSVARQPDPDQPMIYIQTDAAVNPGNSGGPLVDVQGHLIGINTFILSESGGSQGLNFAIPSVVVRFVYEQILDHGHVHRLSLGLHLQALTPTLAAALSLTGQHGLLASDVLPDTPAAGAGIAIRDIVLALNGAPVDSLPEYEAALYRAPHGKPVTLAVLRGSKKMSFTLEVLEENEHEFDDLASFVDPNEGQVAALGILAIEVTPTIASLLDDLRIESGVLVAARAAEAGIDTGLESGDLIHAVNGTAIKTIKELRAALASLKPGDPVALQIEREGRLSFLAFELE